MTARAHPVSRRWFIGAGAAIAGFGLPPGATAQPAADGFRLLRARALPSTGLGNTGNSDLGYDGIAPGPTLRVRRGDELRVRLVNDLPAPTSVHWHGIRLPNAMDGVPQLTQPAAAPGASFDYRFRPPDAGTFWYHAYIAGQTERGLAGAFIVEDTQPVDVDRDIALLLTAPAAADGPPVLVNGSVRPDIAVKTGERLRLRIVNAATARGVFVRLDGHAVRVMAIDGQPAEPFLARDSRLGLGPGNRIDLFIDTLGDAGAMAPLLAAPLTDAKAERPIARLVYERGDAARVGRRSEPLPLPPNPLPARIDLRTSLKAELMLANARVFDPAGPPLFTVKRGRAVTLAIRNSSSHPHVMHLHGHSFRMLDRLDDGWKPFWMDTLVVGDPIERIAFVADNPGKWLIECTALERQDSGAAVWFAVN
jgi:FtsP/CotA-like multicopper oxidase with cupredoxin domain